MSTFFNKIFLVLILPNLFTAQVLQFDIKFLVDLRDMVVHFTFESHVWTKLLLPYYISSFIHLDKPWKHDDTLVLLITDGVRGQTSPTIGCNFFFRIQKGTNCSFIFICDNLQVLNYLTYTILMFNVILYFYSSCFIHSFIHYSFYSVLV